MIINNKEQTLTNTSPAVHSTASIKVPTSNDPSLSADRVKRLLEILLNRSRNKHLYERILKQVMARIPNLDANRAYTLKQICGEEFWGQLEKDEVIEVGQWIVLVVTRKLLPLRFGGKNGSNHQTYYLN